MKQLTVGIADMKTSKEPESKIITHSLGSCLAVCIYDPAVKVGGMLHLMLPESKIDPIKGQKNPFMFADTGIPLLFRSCYELGMVRSRVEVWLVGASQIMDSSGAFEIGKRNYLAARKLLWKKNIMIKAEEVGGITPRTVWMDIATGNVTVRLAGRQEKRL